MLSPLAPFPMRDVRPDVVPAVAAKDDPVDPLIFWAWADAQRPAGDVVGFQISSLSGPPVIGTVLATNPPVRALAVAPSGAGWVLFVLDGAGLTTSLITDDGQNLGTTGEVSAARGEQVGEPAAASSRTGEVALVFPLFQPATLSVQLRARLFAPFAWPDAGTPDAGLDAGVTRDAGPGDAGPADAGNVDAGVAPDGGTDPLVFDTSGCSCATAPSTAGWWVLLALALLAARRATRG
jgi:MYXO-CTERM domain-containing protein